jgi:hypothetical protein
VDAIKEHIILGMDEGDVEKLKDLWLSENPAIKVLRARMRRERNLFVASRGAAIFDYFGI